MKRSGQARKRQGQRGGARAKALGKGGAALAPGRVNSAATVQTPGQVRALIAPARQEIVDVLETAGPCSVSRLGALLGRPADALYHHLRRLVRVGLVKEVERRKEGRHAFVVFDLAVRPLRLSYEAPVRTADVGKVVAAAQRMAWRDFRRALSAGGGVTQGMQRTLWGSRTKGWATPARIERINQLLAELIETVQGGGPTQGAVPISVSFLLSPAARPRRVEEQHARPDCGSAESATKAERGNESKNGDK
jgi:DNA-binding transcriptional ArsR family regulator